jgi:hypothetical protein
MKIGWLDQPEDHDFPAAWEFLSLTYSETEAHRLVKMLKGAPAAEFAAKDLFRAAKEAPLGHHNAHVLHNIDKIDKGKALSPILIVKDLYRRTLIIADGYHRLCAVVSYDEDARVPVRMAVTT